VESWTAHKHRALIAVRYEDMLEKPLPTFTKVTRFLGLPAGRARIEKAIRFSSFDVLKAQEQRTGFVERSRRADAFFRAGRAGQWR
ncbi:sulfotransferase domain-containing protein, partial [Acinetobacter baumannii]